MKLRTKLSALLLAAVCSWTPMKGLSAEGSCKANLSKENLDLGMNHGHDGCFVQLSHPHDYYAANEKRTRTTQLYSNGLVYFYAETSDKPKMSQSIGTRTIQFLPFKPTMSSYSGPDSSGIIRFITPFGLKAEASTKTGLLTSVEGFDLRIGPMRHIDEMVRKNGDVTVTPRPGFVAIDYGFRLGNISTSQLWRDAIVMDGFGNKCTLKISTFFKNRPGDPDEVDYLYANNDAVKTMLARRCPQIRWQ